MARFAYKALSATGSVTRGRMTAEDEEALKQALRRLGQTPLETRRLTLPGVRTRLDGKALAMATREFAMLLRAGQTVEQALALLAGGIAPKSLQPPFSDALTRLREGSSLADALAQAQFPPIYRAMVQAGEASGALAEQLAQLAALQERAARLREQLISALIYPAFLLVVSVGAVLLLLGLVVPQFAPLFADSHRPLPTATKAVLAASSLLREDGRVLGLAIAALLAAGLAASRRPAVAARLDDFLLRSPIVGRLMLYAATTRWMRVLSVLLKGGVPLSAALDLVKPVAAHQPLQAMLTEMRNGIRQGKGLVAALPENPPLPDPAAALLRVGEQGGQLEESLGHLADLFDNRLEQGLKRTMALFEPACVLFLSMVVGTIVISILLAVVSINDLAF